MPFKNIEDQRNSFRKWRLKNPDKAKLHTMGWYSRNPGTRKLHMDKANWVKKLKVLKKLCVNGKIECVSCGIKDPRVLQVHHIDGSGTRNPKMYYEISKAIRINNTKDLVSMDILEIRCANCNVLAEYELKRRFPSIIGFDNNWNPIWKTLQDIKIENKTNHKA